MTAAAVDLCTLADVKLYLGITDSNSDTLLQTLITAASQFAANYCGRTFQTTSYTAEAYDGTGTDSMLLNQSPVTAVASVSVMGVVLPKATVPGGFGWTFDSIELYMVGGCFNRGRQNVTVTYTAGYATIPMDLSNATVEFVAKKYRDKSKPGVASRSIARESIHYTVGDMPDSTKSVYGLYQRAAPL